MAPFQLDDEANLYIGNGWKFPNIHFKLVGLGGSRFEKENPNNYSSRPKSFCGGLTVKAEKLAPNLDVWQCRCNYPKPETNEQLVPEFLDGKGRQVSFPFGTPYFQVQFVSFEEKTSPLST